MDEDVRYEEVNGNLVDRYDRTAGRTKYWNDGGLYESIGHSTSDATKRRIMHDKPVYYVHDDLKRLRSRPSRRRPELVLASNPGIERSTIGPTWVWSQPLTVKKAGLKKCTTLVGLSHPTHLMKSHIFIRHSQQNQRSPFKFVSSRTKINF